MSRVLVLLSGGLDSAVLATFFKKGGHEVSALSIVYGQKHIREVESAEAVARALGIEQISIQIPHYLFKESALSAQSKIPVPEGEYSLGVIPQTEVPGRNLLFISLAAAVAASKEISRVGIAVHSGDHPVYSDCCPEFVASARSSLSLGFSTPMELEAPFLKLKKPQIVAIGDLMKAPMELTWSCYRGGDKHCGVCPTCLERKQAFIEAKVSDPTIYER